MLTGEGLKLHFPGGALLNSEKAQLFISQVLKSNVQNHISHPTVHIRVNVTSVAHASEEMTGLLFSLNYSLNTASENQSHFILEIVDLKVYGQ